MSPENTPPAETSSEKLVRWSRSTLGPAALGAALLWVALPPLGWGPLGWIAPACWVVLVRRTEMAGHRPYRTLWLTGVCFWLATFYWLWLPYWATGLLGILSALYMGCYLPVFVGLSRVAVHRLRLSPILVCPVVWTGLELARAHILTGTTLANLGHTQYRWIELIQLADLVGEYGVSFLVMLVAACLARTLPANGKRWSIWPPGVAAAAIAAALLYGYDRTGAKPSAPVARIALIQGSIDSSFKSDPKMREMIHQHYRLLSCEAVEQYGDLDLIVWPETMYRTADRELSKVLVQDPNRFFEPIANTANDPVEWVAHSEAIITADPNARTPETDRDRTPGRYRLTWKAGAEAEAKRRVMRAMARQFGTPLLLGAGARHIGPQRVTFHNSAVLVSEDGQLQGPYHKMHLVLLGEYVPLADRWPWLYEMTPLNRGLTPGQEPVSLALDGLRISPNICYETVVPHVIRRQVKDLTDADEEPDLLVNLTNDGWFWGSSELDMHLVCGVFRAVECRKPLLVAANTGISAHIDADGRIVARGPRRSHDPQPDADLPLTRSQRQRRQQWCQEFDCQWPEGTAKVLAEVCTDPRQSWYVRHGDWPAGICLMACVALAVLGYRRNPFSRKD
ncbi:MAG: apolipoprotein N-acyltransferase [Candidatus Nealsonbacteria bacterium]|nr:apolipoprotein N-acyltransferase [Candidatus Nealsonbacteria bacterium]